ncbi:MAG: hypothetical protein V9G10_12975 [Candidatus Nanopelagicales bacterium]
MSPQPRSTSSSSSALVGLAAASSASAWLVAITSRIAVTSPQPRQAPWPPVVA